MSEVRIESSPRTSTPSISAPSSSSKKKLAKCDEVYSTGVSEKYKNIIIDLSILSSVLEEYTCCSLCGEKINITEDVSKRNGLVCTLIISCENCKSQKQFPT